MIFLAADHFGIEVKNAVKAWLIQQGMKYTEFGSRSNEDKCSIADFIPKVAEAVLQSPDNRGIMICGTGVGVDIGANRFKGIRSVLASTPTLAEWSRAYDNSNVLCLSGWKAEENNITAILEAWFGTSFVDLDGSKNAFLSAMDKWS